MPSECKSAGEESNHAMKSDGTAKKAEKRKLVWDWKVGALVGKADIAPAKQKKPSHKGSKEDKPSEKYICLECLDICLKGKREERLATICRIDASSVKRHKARWHNLPHNETCTFVPQNALEVKKRRAENEMAREKGIKTQEEEPATKHQPSDANTTSLLQKMQRFHDNPKGQESGILSAAICKEDDDHSPSQYVEHTAIFEPIEPLVTEGAKVPSTLLQFQKPEVASSAEATLDHVMEAISNLTLKVDNIEKQHVALTQFAFEDGTTRKSITGMREAQNIFQLAEASQLIEWFYDESSETAVLRCLPCFRLHVVAKPHIVNLTPLQAQRILNSTSSGTLATGMFLKRDITRLLIRGQNATWYRQKNICIEHLSMIGHGSKVHKKALDAYMKEKELANKRSSAITNIFRAAIVDLKLGAAGKHLETLISFLALCSVDVGNIGHSRKHFSDILYCLEKTVNHKITTWLSKPLPSTQLPPHFWVTVDKGTPSRTTNQAILIIARDENGIPCPIPVAAPQVYRALEAASYESLALMILKAFEVNFSKDLLPRLCGVAADGPYQATGFRSKLLEELGIFDEDDSQIMLPVSWDAAHAMNLGVLDVKDSKTQSGTHFQRFIKRCNVFNTILAHGKGFAFLQLVDSSARRPVSFASQRFASSSYEQWVKIEKSFHSFWQAFDILHPNRSEEEEYQYMIAGSDFVADLLAFLDTLEPVVELMLRVQSLDTPIWKLKSWWPCLKAKMEKTAEGGVDSFPRLKKIDPVKPGMQYKDVKLLEGWLITAVNGTGRDKQYTWQMREETEINDDHRRFAEDLLLAIEKRVSTITSHEYLGVLQVFDAAQLVQLQCGKRNSGVVAWKISAGEYDTYGVEECQEIMKVISRMQHIEECGIDFDPRLAYRYMICLKEAVAAGVWDGLCPEWFIDVKTSMSMKLGDLQIVEFSPTQTTSEYESTFMIKLSDGSEIKVRLHEQSVYASFYSNERIFSIAKPPSCIILDVVLSKGGPEAIAESYYSAMRAQQKSGGQSDENLGRRTKLSWCLPSLKNCDDIIEESVKTYLKGDENIRAHRQNTFFSGRTKQYEVSKVVDRVNADTGRCPFLV